MRGPLCGLLCGVGVLLGFESGLAGFLWGRIEKTLSNSGNDESSGPAASNRRPWPLVRRIGHDLACLKQGGPNPTSDPSRARPAQTRRHRLRLALRADNLRPSRSRHPPRRLPTHRFRTPALRHRAHTATRPKRKPSGRNSRHRRQLPGHGQRMS